MSITNLADLSNVDAEWKKGVGFFDATSGGSAVTADKAGLLRWHSSVGSGLDLTCSKTNTPILDAATGGVISTCLPDYKGSFQLPSFTAQNGAQTWIWVVELQALKGSAVTSAGSLSFRRLTQHGTGSMNCRIKRGGIPNIENDGNGVDHDTALRVPSSRSLLIFRAGASAKFVVNGDSEALPSVTGATVLTQNSFSGAFGSFGNNGQDPLQALVLNMGVVARNISDSEISDIQAWAVGQGVRFPSSCTQNLVIESHSFGENYKANSWNGWTQKITTPSNCLVYNNSEAGITVATILSDRQYASSYQAGKTNILYLDGAVNDFFASRTAAQVYADIKSICTDARSVGYSKIIVAKCCNYGAAVSHGQRTTYNGLLAGGVGLDCDLLIDQDNTVALTDPSNTTYFNADALHPNDAGHLAYAGMVQAAINQFITAPSSGGAQFNPTRSARNKSLTRR